MSWNWNFEHPAEMYALRDYGFRVVKGLPILWCGEIDDNEYEAIVTNYNGKYNLYINCDNGEDEPATPESRIHTDTIAEIIEFWKRWNP